MTNEAKRSEESGSTVGLATERFVIRNGKGDYYQFWWETYGEAVWCRSFLDAKKMSRQNCNRILRRLRDPKIWGDNSVYKEVANGEVRGASPEGEASASTVVLGAVRPGKD